MDQRAELIAEIQALYRRLHADALRPADLLALADVEFATNEDLAEAIYRDRATFDTYFTEFAPTYDIFRVFTADQIVLDVGAHWGYSAVAMRHQGCAARIVSIEAMPMNIPALRRLKQAAGGSYDFHHVAASDREGQVRFYLPAINGQLNTGLASTGGTLNDEYAFLLANLADRYPPPDGGRDVIGLVSLVVPARPIDLVMQRATAPIAAIKMDVEGHEVFALRGAQGILTTQKPLLMVEGGSFDSEVTGFLAAQGYFYCERDAGKLVRNYEIARRENGFWLHAEKAGHYAALGLLRE